MSMPIGEHGMKTSALEALEGVIAGSEKIIAEEEMVQDLYLAFQDTRWASVNVQKQPLKKPAKKAPAAAVRAPQAIITTEALEKELDNRAQKFVDLHPILKKEALKELKRLVDSLGPEAKSREVLECVTSFYGAGHEAEASYALDFLAEATTGDVNSAVVEARSIFFNGNKENIAKAKAIENASANVKSQVGGDQLTLYNRFVNYLVTQPTPTEMYKQLKRDYPNPQERGAMITALYRSIGNEVRTMRD